MDGLEQIERCAHTHQIAWTILRQQLGHSGGAVFALAGLFADGQSADRKAVEVKLRNPSCTLHS